MEDEINCFWRLSIGTLARQSAPTSKNYLPAKKKTKPQAAKKRNSAADRNKVAGGQKHEVAYAAKKMGVTAAAVKVAIKKVGNMRKDVEAELKK